MDGLLAAIVLVTPWKCFETLAFSNCLIVHMALAM